MKNVKLQTYICVVINSYFEPLIIIFRVESSELMH